MPTYWIDGKPSSEPPPNYTGWIPENNKSNIPILKTSEQMNNEYQVDYQKQLQQNQQIQAKKSMLESPTAQWESSETYIEEAKKVKERRIPINLPTDRKGNIQFYNVKDAPGIQTSEQAIKTRIDEINVKQVELQKAQLIAEGYEETSLHTKEGGKIWRKYEQISETIPSQIIDINPATGKRWTEPSNLSPEEVQKELLAQEGKELDWKKSLAISLANPNVVEKEIGVIYQKTFGTDEDVKRAKQELNIARISGVKEYESLSFTQALPKVLLESPATAAIPIGAGFKVGVWSLESAAKVGARVVLGKKAAEVIGKEIVIGSGKRALRGTATELLVGAGTSVYMGADIISQPTTEAKVSRAGLTAIELPGAVLGYKGTGQLGKSISSLVSSKIETPIETSKMPPESLAKNLAERISKSEPERMIAKESIVKERMIEREITKLQKAYEIAGMTQPERVNIKTNSEVLAIRQGDVLETKKGKVGEQKTRADYAKESLAYIKSVIGSELKPTTKIKYIERFEILKILREGISKETIVPIIKETKIPRPDKPIKPRDITGLFDVNFERAEIKSYRPNMGAEWARASIGEGELKITKTITPEQKLVKIEESLMDKELQIIFDKIFGKELSKKMFGKPIPKMTVEIKPETKTYSSELKPEKVTFSMESKELFIESDILIKDNKLYKLATTDAIEATFKEIVNPAEMKADNPITFIDKGIRTGTFGITEGKALGRRHWDNKPRKASERLLEEYDAKNRQQQKLLEKEIESKNRQQQNLLLLEKEIESKKVIEKEVSLYEGKPIISSKDIISPEDIFKIFSGQIVTLSKKMKSARFAPNILYGSEISDFEYDYSNVYPTNIPNAPSTIKQILNIYGTGVEQKIQTKQEERTKQFDILKILDLYKMKEVTELDSRNRANIELGLKSLNLQKILTEISQRTETQTKQEQRTSQRTETQTKQEQRTKQAEIEIGKLIQIGKMKRPPPIIPSPSTQPTYKQPKRSGVRILQKRRFNPVDINVIFPPKLQKKVKGKQPTPEEYMSMIFIGNQKKK